MELWIRSQDRMKLCNAKVFSLDNDQTGIFCNSCEDSYVFVGKYKTKERALEILDDISSKIKNQFIVKIDGVWRPDDVKRMKEQLMEYYAGDYIMETKPLDIKPINQNLIYYEMPKE